MTVNQLVLICGTIGGKRQKYQINNQVRSRAVSVLYTVRFDISPGATTTRLATVFHSDMAMHER